MLTMLSRHFNRVGRSALLLMFGMILGASVGYVGFVTGSDTQGPAAAITACSAAASSAGAYDPNVQLRRAELSTAGSVAAWQEGRHATPVGDAPAVTGLTSAFRSQSGKDVVAVCIYSGQFSAPMGPPPLDGSVKQPYNRIRLLVRPNGEVVLDAVGHDNGDMNPETPGDWGQ